MKIEVQIGCEFGYADIVRSVLENMDARTQLVASMSSAVTRHDYVEHFMSEANNGM